MLQPTSPSRSQIVTGFVDPSYAKSQGRDEIFWMSRPLFRNLLLEHKTLGCPSEGSHPSINYSAMLKSRDSLPVARSIVVQALAVKLSTTLSIPVADVETDKPVHAYRVDSLITLEIRYWFLKEFKAEMAVFDI